MKVSVVQMKILMRLVKGDEITHQPYMGWFNSIPYWYFSDPYLRVRDSTMYSLRKAGLVTDGKLTEKGKEYIEKVMP